MTMIKAVFYEKKTGQIINVVTCSKNQLQLQTCEPECTYLLHDLNTPVYGKEQYVKNKQVIWMPQRPSDFHVFNYGWEQWVLNEEQAWASVRNERNQKLSETDWLMMPDVSISDTERQQWRDYRQRLRDITDDQQDPLSIEWPDKPQG